MASMILPPSILRGIITRCCAGCRQSVLLIHQTPVHLRLRKFPSKRKASYFELMYEINNMEKKFLAKMIHNE